MICRFERSPLPEHADTDTIVARVLKFPEPPTLVGPASTIEQGLRRTPYLPKQGELLQYPGKGSPWHHTERRETDHLNDRAFSVLLDNERHLGSGGSTRMTDRTP